MSMGILHVKKNPGRETIVCLGGGLKHFLFTPLPGEMIQFD